MNKSHLPQLSLLYLQLAATQIKIAEVYSGAGQEFAALAAQEQSVRAYNQSLTLCKSALMGVDLERLNRQPELPELDELPEDGATDGTE